MSSGKGPWSIRTVQKAANVRGGASEVRSRSKSATCTTVRRSQLFPQEVLHLSRLHTVCITCMSDRAADETFERLEGVEQGSCAVVVVAVRRPQQQSTPSYVTVEPGVSEENLGLIMGI